MNTAEAELIITIGSVLSYIGTLFVVGTYYYVESLQKIPAFKIIFQIAVADFYYVSVGLFNMLYASKAGGTECEVIGFIAEHAALAASTWAYYFAYIMHGVFTQKIKNIKELREKFTRDAILLWLFPLVFAVIPLFFTGGYGYSYLYCWISETLSIEIYYTLVITVLYLPMGIQIVLLLVYYCKIYSAFKNSAENNEQKALIMELMFYPIGVVLNYLLSGIDRFINVGFGLNWLWFSYFHIFVKQSQGFLNALIYGYSSKVRAMIRNRKVRKDSDGTNNQTSLNQSFEMISTASKQRGSLVRV